MSKTYKEDAVRLTKELLETTLEGKEATLVKDNPKYASLIPNCRYYLYEDTINFLEEEGVIEIVTIKEPRSYSPVLFLDNTSVFIAKLNRKKGEEFLEKQGEIDKSFCQLKDGVFSINLPSGKPEIIDFATKRGNTSISDVFEILFNHWNNYGEKWNGWISATISKTELKQKLVKVAKTDNFDKWLSDTIASIRRDKIKPKNLEEWIIIDFDKTSNGYKIEIKKP